jgi:hypothetical protein
MPELYINDKNSIELPKNLKLFKVLFVNYTVLVPNRIDGSVILVYPDDDASSMPNCRLAHRVTVRLPYGMYESEYHTLAQNCIIINNNKIINLSGPGKGIKTNSNVNTKHDR